LPVRIHIDSRELKQFPLRVGLSMTVTVDTHQRKGSALTTLSPKEVIDQSQNEELELKAASYNKLLHPLPLI
jgi:membrane fusion protein (multidrug efflux system)